MDGLRAVRSQNRNAHQEVERFIASLKNGPYAGHELRDELAGYRAEHVYRDTYRVVWTVDGTDIVVHRVGLRFPTGTAGIYADLPPLPGDEGPVGESTP